jgi:hypothetical protein
MRSETRSRRRLRSVTVVDARQHNGLGSNQPMMSLPRKLGGPAERRFDSEVLV